MLENDNTAADDTPVAQPEVPASVAQASDLAYAAAVIANQAEIPLDQAEVNAALLPADQLIALVVAGRDGQVALCREILGLE